MQLLRRDWLSDNRVKLAPVAGTRDFLRFQDLLLGPVSLSAARKRFHSPEVDRAMKFLPQDFKSFCSNWEFNRWGNNPEVVHLDIVYLLICGVLNLNVSTAREKGLRLMVDMGTRSFPPRIGMSSVDFASYGEGTQTFAFRGASPWNDRHEDHYKKRLYLRQSRWILGRGSLPTVS